VAGKPETTALGNVIDCAENCSTGVLDVANAFDLRSGINGRENVNLFCKPRLSYRRIASELSP
jgi:hypothetical protein